MKDPQVLNSTRGFGRTFERLGQAGSAGCNPGAFAPRPTWKISLPSCSKGPLIFKLDLRLFLINAVPKWVHVIFCRGHESSREVTFRHSLDRQLASRSLTREAPQWMLFLSIARDLRLQFVMAFVSKSLAGSRDFPLSGFHHPSQFGPHCVFDFFALRVGLTQTPQPNDVD